VTEPLRVVFVAGAGRSGSTLLDLMLGASPGAVSVGELRHIWNLGFGRDEFCGCGELFSACPFWSAVVDDAFGAAEVDGPALSATQERLLRSRNVLGLASPRLASAGLLREREAWRERHLHLLHAIARAAAATTVVDSSKNPMYGLLVAGMPGIDFRVVHLVRDSRAVAYSWTKRLKPHPLRGGEPVFDLAADWQAGSWWLLANALSETLPALRRHYLRVRYEDLARRPGPVIARVCAFAGLEAVAPLPGSSHEFSLGVHHTTGGNPLRWEQGITRVRPDTEWKAALAPGTRRAITAMTFPLLVRYGYRLRR
jgi:hypothetical protein